ncbi:hypothetical protein GCM10010199_51150 [Dactylosporangium roseum]
MAITSAILARSDDSGSIADSARSLESSSKAVDRGGRDEHRALGDTRRLGDLPCRDRRAVAAQQRQGRRDERRAPVVESECRHSPTTGLVHVRDRNERALTRSTDFGTVPVRFSQSGSTPAATQRVRRGSPAGATWHGSPRISNEGTP